MKEASAKQNVTVLLRLLNIHRRHTRSGNVAVISHNMLKSLKMCLWQQG